MDLLYLFLFLRLNRFTIFRLKHKASYFIIAGFKQRACIYALESKSKKLGI